MTCTPQELDDARADGIAAALRAIDDEIKRATREVTYSNKPKSQFAAGNRDRAVLRMRVLKKVRAKIAAL